MWYQYLSLSFITMRYNYLSLSFMCYHYFSCDIIIFHKINFVFLAHILLQCVVLCTKPALFNLYHFTRRDNFSNSVFLILAQLFLLIIISQSSPIYQNELSRFSLIQRSSTGTSPWLRNTSRWILWPLTIVSVF